MTLRLSRLRAQAGLRAVRDQAVVYRILTRAGDIVGTVHHNGDGIQLRWAIPCPYCGAELGDRSRGASRFGLHRRRLCVHPDIETRLLRAIRATLQGHRHLSGPCGYYHPSGGPSMRQCRGSSRDRRRIDRANRRAASRVADAINLTTTEPTP